MGILYLYIISRIFRYQNHTKDKYMPDPRWDLFGVKDLVGFQLVQGLLGYSYIPQFCKTFCFMYSTSRVQQSMEKRMGQFGDGDNKRSAAV